METFGSGYARLGSCIEGLRSRLASYTSNKVVSLRFFIANNLCFIASLPAETTSRNISLGLSQLSGIVLFGKN